MGLGLGVGDGVGEGVGDGVAVGVGKGDVTVLATRSLISEGPLGVPSPVSVFAVAPPVGVVLGLLPHPPLHPQSPQFPNPPQPLPFPMPPPGLLVEVAAIAWKSPADAPVAAR